MKDTVHHLKDKLDKREKEWRGLLKAKKIDASVINQLKTEISKRNKKIELLESQIAQLKKKKALPAKPKPSKPKPVAKQYRARITAKHSYYSQTDWEEKNKYSETLDITIDTQKLYKKPSQSFFKSYIKLAAQDTYYTGGKLGMAIDYVNGLGSLKYGLRRNSKISSIQFISIEEKRW